MASVQRRAARVLGGGLLGKGMLGTGALGMAAAWMPGAANAGAWTLPQGQGQVILTLEGKAADQRFDDGGARVSIDQFDKAELAAYFEYGLLDRVTLIVAPRFLRASMAPPDDQISTGFGRTELGGRVLLGRFDPPTEGFWRGSVFSFQATALIPGTVDVSDPLLGSEGLAEYDTRLLTGTAFAAGGWTGFVDLAGAYRVRTGAAPDEVRFDATLGLRPQPRLTLLAQAFTTATVEPGTPSNPDGWYLRAQLGVLYDLDAAWSVQAAVNTVVAGRNALAETGGLVGLWYRF